MKKVPLFHIHVDNAPYCHRGRPCSAAPGENCGLRREDAGELGEALSVALGASFSVAVKRGGCPLAGSGLAAELQKEEKPIRLAVVASLMVAISVVSSAAQILEMCYV